MTTEQEEWVRGDWIQLFSGNKFYPKDPQPEDIDHRDIAHALSLLCRYGGHVQRFYSVAEHCVLMSRAVAPEHALEALLHDATEAYVGDVIRPLKRYLPDYQAVEAEVWSAIITRFGALPIVLSEEVKAADSRILLDERAILMPNTKYAWPIEDLKPLGVHVWGWSPPEAETAYLMRLEELRR